MVTRFPRFALLACCLLLICGCATLPSRATIVPSTAFQEPDSTALGRITANSLATADGSGFRLLHGGAYAFRCRVALIREAQRSLDLQYYIFRDDVAGKIILTELLAAARRGVRVRLLLDDLGTDGEDQVLLAMASTANVQVRMFNPFPGARGSLFTKFLSSVGDFGRLDHRMHNKLFIADNAMAITGGRNIGEEYFMHAEAGNFLDLDVLAAGRIVPKLSNVFDEFWNSPYTYPISSLVQADDAVTAATIASLDERVGQVAVDLAVPDEDFGYSALLTEFESGRVALTEAEASVVADSPAKVAGVTEQNEQVTAQVNSSAIRLAMGARSDVVIVSPYFVPGRDGVKRMSELRARGVSIQLFTNSLASTDVPLAYFGYARYRTEMLKMGMTIYEMTTRPKRRTLPHHLAAFGSSRANLHAKVAIVDHRLLYIGSMNRDARSARENTEMGVIIDSSDLAGRVRRTIDAEGPNLFFRVTLDAEGRTVWLEEEAGRTIEHTDEPDAGFFLRYGLRWFAPLAPEDLL